ncbi:hypothetical protein FDECE_6668 [Fusarium decemcellulare]|nr:hypothetical protein FDECE_6668 [Fusarium decemcellulare]
MAKQAWEIGSGPGLDLQITGDLPQESTFANHNYALSPRNSLIVTSGWGQVNQTTLLTYGNIFPACLDGPKRDRLIWLGDYYHTARIIGVSTARYDLERGTFESLLPTQLKNGKFSICAPLGYEANTTVLNDVYGLDDYQLLGMLPLYFYVQSSNDVDFVRHDWAVGNISPDDGLVHLESAFTEPAEVGSAVSCLTIQALRSMAEVATAVDNFKSAKRWLTATSSLANATSEKLWNQETGTWKLSTSSPGNFSIAATAFCIEARVATPEQATRTVKALDRLALGPGYLDNTIVDPASPTASISPNTNGFLLSALFQTGEVECGAKLIDTLWGPMVDNDLTSSGASWEYVLHDGTPGLGLFTSLGHPWGGAATYVLTEWAAGLRAAEGVQGWGYRNRLVDPTAGIAMGLKRATARVQTTFDGTVQVTWDLVQQRQLHLAITAPKHTVGVFRYRDVEKHLHHQESYEFTVNI